MTLRSAADNFGRIYFSDGTSGDDEYRGIIQYDHTNNRMQFAANASTAITIDSSGRLLVGTTTEGNGIADTLTISESGSSGITIRSGTTSEGNIAFSDGTSGADEYRGLIRYDHESNFMSFWSNASERFRVDGSGRLLLGTTSESGNAVVTIRGSAGSTTGAGVLDIGIQTTRPTASGSTIGGIRFTSTSNSSANYHYASIFAETDGTSSSDTDIPGRIVFSTTADGSSSPTERMRITNYGKMLINRTSAGAGSTAGLEMKGSAVDTNYTFAVYDATGSDRVISVRNDNHLVSTTTYARTTAGSANIHIDSAGFMARSTSSIKYKSDVETIEEAYSEALLKCRPVWYRSTSERDNPQWGWWGFIAEEVAEIDPRLVHWKTTTTELDENGELQDVVLDNSEPEGVQYDRFVPHLLNLIKRQKEQIEAMEARLSALEAS